MLSKVPHFDPKLNTLCWEIKAWRANENLYTRILDPVEPKIRFFCLMTHLTLNIGSLGVAVEIFTYNH